MPLAPEKLALIQKHLSGLGGACPLCRENNWAVGEDVVVTPIFDVNTKIAQLDRFMPLVALTCNQCGNTALIAAGKINGLIH